MSAAHLQNYHSPASHNERVKRLVRKFDNQLKKVKGERNEIIAREVESEKLSFPDIARASDLYLQIADLSRTLEQLDSLILPEEN